MSPSAICYCRILCSLVWQCLQLPTRSPHLLIERHNNDVCEYPEAASFNEAKKLVNGIFPAVAIGAGTGIGMYLFAIRNWNRRHLKVQAMSLAILSTVAVYRLMTMDGGII